jgi:hypothetical protein
VKTKLYKGIESQPLKACPLQHVAYPAQKENVKSSWKQIQIEKGPKGGWLKVWEFSYPIKHESWKQMATHLSSPSILKL